MNKNLMGSVLIRLLSLFYTFLDKLIPRSNSVCFISFPDFDGNALAYFQYMVHRESLPVCVWLTSSADSAKSKLMNLADVDQINLNKIKVIKKNSLIGLFAFVRAKQVFFTHGHYCFVNACKSDVKLINLWHGMPLKAIGQIGGEKLAKTQSCNLAICSSPFFQPIIAEAFNIPQNKVLVTGAPRCDVLLMPIKSAILFKSDIAA